MTDAATRPPLAARTALGGAQPWRTEIGGRVLAERDDLAIASVAARRGGADAVAAQLAARAGADCGVGAFADGQELGVFWTGPEQWMALADYGRHETLAADLKTALGAEASVTEQTDGWVVFALSGPGLRAVFERLTALDLCAFEPGSASRTVIEHHGVYLLRRAAPEAGWLILGLRSAAGSLRHAITDAMTSAERIAALGD